jgi:hypothetical protein
MTIVLENAQTQKNEAGQYLIGKLHLDDPSWELIHQLEDAFGGLLNDAVIDDVRSDEDFKWGCWMMYQIIDDLKEIRSCPTGKRRDELCEGIVDYLLGEESEYRAMAAILKAVSRLDFERHGSDGIAVMQFLKGITDVQSKFPYRY